MSRKRIRDDEQSSPLTAPAFTGECFHINTHVLCGKELTDDKHQVVRAVRELLLNSLDQDENATVTIIDPPVDEEGARGSTCATEGDSTSVVVCRIANRLSSDSSYGICRRSFEYRPNEWTASNATKSGKYGYGLKDALAMLQYNHVTYVADGRSGRFETYTNQEGLIHVRCLRGGAPPPTETPPRAVEMQIQELRCSRKDCAALVEAVHLAISQCLPLREEYRTWTRYEVTPKTAKRPVGVIFLPPVEFKGAVKVHHLFVANQGYAFTYRSDFIQSDAEETVIDDEGTTTRKPLACLYQLFMDKSTMAGRDRVGLPRNWNKTLETLVAAAPDDVLVYLLRNSNQKCYERAHSQRISAALVDYSKRKDEERKKVRETVQALTKEQDALRGRAAALASELEGLERERAGPALTDAAKDSLERQAKLVADSITATLERQAVVERELGRYATTKDAKGTAAICSPSEAAGAAAGCRAEVVVVQLRHWEAAVATDDEVATVVSASSTNDPLWHLHPTVDEYRYLLRQGIPMAYFPLFRCVHRFLLILSLDEAVVVEHDHRFLCERLTTTVTTATPSDVVSAAAPLTPLVPRPTHRLICCFDASMSRSEFLRSVVMALAMAPVVGVCRPLLCGGMSVVETVAHMAAEAQLETEEDPRKLKAKRMHHCGTTTASQCKTSFCPLLVCTEWDNKQGGISSFNIQLAKGLASQGGVTVFVLVLASRDHADESAVLSLRRENIFLFWLDRNLSVTEAPVPAMTHRECAAVSHIVGHAHITGPAAKKISELRQFSHAVVWQFNHVTPALVDVLKEAGSAQQRFASSASKEHEIAVLNRRAHCVFSVGELMYQHFAAGYAHHARVILPLNPLFHKTTTLRDFPRDVVRVLYFGRTEGVYFVKGVDIAVRACERAFHRLKAEEGRLLQLTVQGTPAGKEAETLDVLRRECAPAYRDFCPRIGEFASPDEVQEILTTKTSLVIMPSRVEPFGLVAMEAIACGVPVLVSDNSGVALLLKEHRFGHMCVPTSVVRPGGAEPTDNLSADIAEWERAILATIHRGPKAFQDALDLREALQKSEALNHAYQDLVQRGCADIML